MGCWETLKSPAPITKALPVFAQKVRAVGDIRPALVAGDCDFLGHDMATNLQTGQAIADAPETPGAQKASAPFG